jgi:hypothetical protein
MMVWHYTIADRADGILEDGLIRPATAGVPDHEKPVVWFSANPRWEPTANKIIMTMGTERVLSTNEMLYSGFAGSLWRFGVQHDALIPWVPLQRIARIKKKEAKRLSRKAIKDRANPMHWYGSLEPVRVEDTTIECHNRYRGWYAYDNKGERSCQE